MAAPIDMMGLIHKLTAEKFLKMIEEGVEIEETDNEGNVTVRCRRVDLVYTHHSCVFGCDRNSYDGMGIRAMWVSGGSYSPR